MESIEASAFNGGFLGPRDWTQYFAQRNGGIVERILSQYDPLAESITHHSGDFRRRLGAGLQPREESIDTDRSESND